MGGRVRRRWRITRGSDVVYIRAEGEGIGGCLSTATEDSLWKMAQLPIIDDDVIRGKRAFPQAVSYNACVYVCKKYNLVLLSL